MQKLLFPAFLVLMVSSIAHAVEDAGTAPCGMGAYQVTWGGGFRYQRCIKAQDAGTPPCSSGTYEVKEGSSFGGRQRCIKAQDAGRPPCTPGTYDTGGGHCIK
jgi:hypothetical protein